MFVFFLVFEFALPQSIVGQVQIDGVTMTCYRDSSQNGIHGCIRPSNTSDACDIVTSFRCPVLFVVSMMGFGLLMMSSVFLHGPLMLLCRSSVQDRVQYRCLLAL